MRDDTINHERLRAEAPNIRKMELDYRVKGKTAREEISHALFVLALMSVCALGASILTRFAGPYLGQLSAMAIAGNSAVFVGLYVLIKTRGNWNYAILAFLGFCLVPFLMFALYHSTQSSVTQCVFLILALAVLAYQVDAITSHYARWMIANPRLSKSTRAVWSKTYDSRVSPLKWFSFWREMRAKKTKVPTALGSYSMNILVIAALYAVLPLIPYKLFGATLTLIVPPAYALLRLRAAARGKNSVRLAFRVTGRAVISWLTYGRAVSNAPGIFRSPLGGYKRRLWITGTTLFMLSLCIVPHANYFPVLYEMCPQGFYDSISEDYYQDNVGGAGPLHKSLAINCLSPRDVPDLETYIGRVPGAPVWAAAEKFLDPGQYSYFLVTTSAVLSLLLPLIAIGSAILASSALSLADAYNKLEVEGSESQIQGTEWDCHAERLRNSSEPLEKQHLWLGTHAIFDYPILLDKSILAEHAYIVGDSGSGKTALGIAPLLTQLIRRGDAGIVILDLKGDTALFEATRTEAEKAGRTFKHFTNELGKSTYTFNPFRDANVEEFSINQFCEIILEALNLNHGEGYGRSYYSRVARKWLSSKLKQHRKVASFDDLYKQTTDQGALRQSKDRQDAFELLSVIESLATFDQLNITPGADKYSSAVLENAIHMPDVISQHQVVYFWLPAAIESASVREIAKLALYSLLNSAYRQARSDEGAAQTYLVIDEFQRIASENFKIILEQARSLGIGAIISNQTFADLKTRDADLRSTVQTNTRFKQVFSSTDVDQQDLLMKASGECIELGYSWTQDSEGKNSITSTQRITTRLKRNDIIGISDHPFRSLVHISRGSGYSQYGGFSVPTATSYTISKEDYLARQRAGWPGSSEHTIVTTRPPLPEDKFAALDDRLEAGRKIDEAAASNDQTTTAFRDEILGRIRKLADMP